MPWACVAASSNFYPRSPCGERLPRLAGSGKKRGISIHALLAESDLLHSQSVPQIAPFLSTLSLRRATSPEHYRRKGCAISIHALLAESDSASCTLEGSYNSYFYPRSPCGERRPLIFNVQARKTISIHALLAESDLAYPDMIICTNVISIHALLAESD